MVPKMDEWREHTMEEAAVNADRYERNANILADLNYTRMTDMAREKATKNRNSLASYTSSVMQTIQF